MSDYINFSADLIETHTLIDVRTPLEFAEDNIPGSINVPLLTNDERVIVGTVYKNQGHLTARRVGLELVSPRLSEIVDTIAGIESAKPLVIYCWRGGLRSGSVVALLSLCGIKSRQLKGGYRSFRNLVQNYFEECPFKKRVVVIHGYTGVGKTTFINLIDRKKVSVVDLEGIASHRGSAFGSFGLEQDFSQKHFETLLWDAFRKIPEDIPVILEGESRRIGRYFLPGNLYEAMEGGLKIWCEASMTTRISRLNADYAKDEYKANILESLSRIRKKLGKTRHDELVRLIMEWDVETFTEKLIEWYYDKLYYKYRNWQPDLSLNLENYCNSEKILLEFLLLSGNPNDGKAKSRGL